MQTCPAEGCNAAITDDDCGDENALQIADTMLRYAECKLFPLKIAMQQSLTNDCGSEPALQCLNTPKSGVY